MLACPRHRFDRASTRAEFRCTVDAALRRLPGGTLHLLAGRGPRHGDPAERIVAEAIDEALLRVRKEPALVSIVR